MAPRFLPVPADWRNAKPYYEPALDRAWTALRDPRTPERLQRYYTVTEAHAGATFTKLGATDPSTITPEDFVAAAIVDVKLKPITVRALLDDPDVRSKVTSLLTQIPVDARLEDVDAPLLAVMDELYGFLRDLIPTSGARYETHWATAAKLLSAKRPSLFPVRDEVICRYLQLWPSRYQVDWQVFAYMLSQEDLATQIRRVVDRASEAPGVDVGSVDHTLRHLDVVVFMHAPHTFHD